MTTIENKSFSEERALYGSDGIRLIGCRFEGEEDGESALKESRCIRAEGCKFKLRYPFWHTEDTRITDCELTESCRAPIWYSNGVSIENTLLHGVKAVRECKGVSIAGGEIISPEFGWSTTDLSFKNTCAEGEYFCLRAENITATGLTFKGKYSFQYVNGACFENCILNTKDAFWHAKNVHLKNCTVKGEYLAWYSDGITFENCRIIGTQPLCYAKNLTLINCEMLEADLAFEKSHLTATVTTPMISIKNPASGRITVPTAELILTDKSSTCEIILTDK